MGAPSGVGYAYPDKEASSLLKPFAALTSAYMAKADMKYLNVLGIDFSDSASVELLSTSAVDGVIWYDYSSYSGLNGKVKWWTVPNANGTVYDTLLFTC